jgi:cytochrome c553
MKFRILILVLVALNVFSISAHAQNIEAGKKKAEACAACHGVDGNAVATMFPTLAGQNARYLYLQLKDYKEGRRQNPMMSAMAANLAKEDMQDLAAYFASQKQQRSTFKADPVRIKAGAAKAEESLCAMCHMGGMSGQNEIPRVAGQHPDYVLMQLKNFKSRERHNDAGNMTSLAQTLSENDMENLAHWISSLY